MRLTAIALLLAAAAVQAQQIEFGEKTSPAGKKQYVELLDDSMTLTADKPQEVELRFRVGPGLHINSHTPKDETLLPTLLKLDAQPGVKVLRQEYPAGVPFHLNIGAGETLDTYQGEFRVHLRVEAARGSSELNGVLRYQACDSASCFPPRSLPVKVALTAR